MANNRGLDGKIPEIRGFFEPLSGEIMGWIPCVGLFALLRKHS